MKRSEFLLKISAELWGREIPTEVTELSSLILSLVEKHGMQPSKIPVKKVRPPDFKWGVMCTMRCICSDCDPEFLVTEWEKE